MFPTQVPKLDEGRLKKWHFAVAAALAAVQLVLLVATAQDIGYAKDEGYYFSAARSNYSWFKTLKDAILRGEPSQAFSDAVIRRHWDNNHEHPGLAKVIMGLSKAVFHDVLGLFKEGTAYRMATMIFSSLVVFLTFLMGAYFFEATVGLAAALALMLMPRYFFHSHLNTFDIPNVFFWTGTVLLFWVSITRPRLMPLFGIAWGLAMAMRNSGVFISVVVFLLWLLSPYRKAFFAAFKNFGRGIRAFGAWRWAVALLWVGLLANAAYLQWSGVWRATKTGLYALILVAGGVPLLFGIVRLVREWKSAKSPIAATFDGWILTALGIVVILLELRFASRFTPFNALLLLVWLFLAGHVIRQYVRHAQAIPIWAQPIIAPAVLGPLTFFLVWPWLYHHTWQRLGEFLMRHLNPPAWQTIYFGEMITNPPPYPVSYPFVMWAFTIPVGFLFLLVVGFGVGLIEAKRTKPPLTAVGEYSAELLAWKHSLRAQVWFLAINLLLPPLVIALPSTPVYGGTKHYMHAYPFLCVFVGLGLKTVARATSEVIPRVKPAIANVLAAIVLYLPALIGLVATHPYQLGYYNAVMGGPIAAPEVGMQQSFWAYQTRNILPWLNKHVPQHGAVAFNNLPWDCWDMYKRDGLLRQDLRLAPRPEGADFYITNLWQMYLDGMFDIELQYQTDGIVAQDDLLGLPMVLVHQNQKKNKKLVPTPWD